jgi:hypothetical protein
VRPTVVARWRQSGHYALVPPIDRRTVEAELIGFPLPMIGGAVVAAGATAAAVVVLSLASIHR